MQKYRVRKDKEWRKLVLNRKYSEDYEEMARV